MPKMFHNCTDANGVEVSHNAHPASEFGPAQSDLEPSWPHWMAGVSGEPGYVEPPAESLIHKTKDRMLERLGRGRGGMSFDGDLRPRSERANPAREAKGERPDRA